MALWYRICLISLLNVLRVKSLSPVETVYGQFASCVPPKQVIPFPNFFFLPRPHLALLQVSPPARPGHTMEFRSQTINTHR